MRAIVKGREPHSLTSHRLTPHADYDNYRDKDALRHALVAEQRGLCCYCMGRIEPNADTMKIEHWQCQDNHQPEQLNYRNLLGACLGAKEEPRRNQHCDTRKGNQDLLWSPAEPDHAIESRVQYAADGTIKSHDETFDSQLNEVLNLNLPFLMNRRKGVLDAVLEWWKAHKPVPRDRIERAIRKHKPAHGQLAPYRQVAVWWLSRNL